MVKLIARWSQWGKVREREREREISPIKYVYNFISYFKVYFGLFDAKDTENL